MGWSGRSDALVGGRFVLPAEPTPDGPADEAAICFAGRLTDSCLLGRRGASCRQTRHFRQARWSAVRVVRLQSIAELRTEAVQWDDLWQRSPTTLPATRAQTAALWLEHFTPGRPLCVLAVEDQGQWVGLLPLVQRRLARAVRTATLPNNGWATSGTLLLDPNADSTGTLDCLARAVRDLPWALLWLDEVPLQSPDWQALARSLRAWGCSVHEHPCYQVGRLRIGRDWQSCRAGWSRRHRQQMAAAARRLARKGDVELKVFTRLASHEIEPHLRRAFELEDRSWKGPAGTSVLSTKGMFAFFLRQAQQLAAWDQLELSLLFCGSRAVAFGYGQRAKGVYHSCKVGYDPEFADCSPGQLLRYYMLERFYGLPEYHTLDFQGPLSDAHARWQPQTYTVGRLAVGLPGLRGRVLVGAYRHVWPWVRRLRAKGNGSPQATAAAK